MPCTVVRVLRLLRCCTRMCIGCSCFDVSSTPLLASAKGSIKVNKQKIMNVKDRESKLSSYFNQFLQQKQNESSDVNLPKVCKF